MMRPSWVAILLLATSAACGGQNASVQCEMSSTCDLAGGGMCAAAGTGGHWCAYPDPGCASGYRYSTFQVGDGLSGVCVIASDAGIDAGGGSMPQPVLPPSCLALAPTCGADGNGYCCESITVQGGTYYRGYDKAGDAASGTMAFPATVSDFRLDKYEVTVGRFRAFVAEGFGTQLKPPATGAGAHPNVLGSGWQAAWNASLAKDSTELQTNLRSCIGGRDGLRIVTWTDIPEGNETRPINCVNWYEAMAFCAWDGAFLPTEAEWNYAASGGDQQRAFPWSSPDPASVALDVTRASYAVLDATGTHCLGNGNPDCISSDLIKVGTRPAGDGRWGHSDLAGNVDEFVLDAFGDYPSPCKDCANIDYARTPIVLRGGNFSLPNAQSLRTTYRYYEPQDYRQYFFGFRCARKPQSGARTAMH